MEINSLAIQANALSVHLGGKAILDDVSFKVQQGEVFALLGGNGAGKSTTLKTFLGLIQATQGEAKVLGVDVHSHLSEVRKKIAYLPESVMLYPHLSAMENIQYFLSLAGIAKTVEHIHGALDKVALQEASRDKVLSSYSKGMRQKTAIALALLRDAPVLFLDEPTSGLDPAAIDEFNALVSSLASNGATVFMVTHDVYGACQLASRIGILSQGRIAGSFDRAEHKTIDIDAVHSAFTELNK